MNKVAVNALFLSGLLGLSSPSFAAGTIEPPTPDSTGPANPTPPTLPAPGSNGDPGTGTGIDGPDNAPIPGTDGTGREQAPADPGNPQTDHNTEKGEKQPPRSGS